MEQLTVSLIDGPIAILHLSGEEYFVIDTGDVSAGTAWGVWLAKKEDRGPHFEHLHTSAISRRTEIIIYVRKTDKLFSEHEEAETRKQLTLSHRNNALGGSWCNLHEHSIDVQQSNYTDSITISLLRCIQSPKQERGFVQMAGNQANRTIPYKALMKICVSPI